jgi:hypothetical protein
VSLRRRPHNKKPEPGTICGYCFDRWATVFDHLNPHSNGGSNRPRNLYPSCCRCNAVLSNFVFDTLQEKRDWIKGKLMARGEWKPAVFLELPEDPTADALYVGVERDCVRCGKRIEAKRSWQRFCSTVCRWAEWDKSHPRTRLVP